MEKSQLALSNTISTKKTFKFSKQGLFILSCLAPALILVAVFVYYPLFQGFIMAFQSYTLFDVLNRPFVGLQNFKDVIFTPEFKNIVFNSFIWVAVSLFFQLFFGFIIALYLRKHFRGRGIYQSLIFFPWAMSGFLIGIIWRWMFNGQNGVINDLLIRLGFIDQMIPFLSSPKWAMASVVIANIWYGVTFFTIMLLAALQSVPNELYESADVDGANSVQKLIKVTIPYIMPTIITTVLLRIIWILNFPDIIYGMTNGGPAGSTHILPTYMLEKIIFSQNYGHASAIGVIMIFILTVFSTFYLMATRFDKAGDF